MAKLKIPPSDRHPQQRINTIRVEEEVATLAGPTLEIRFPINWAKKLLPWYRGPGRTILCNADEKRFNLIGATKVPGHLILSYIDGEGELTAESVAGDLIELLDKLLPSRSDGS